MQVVVPHLVAQPPGQPVQGQLAGGLQDAPRGQGATVQHVVVDVDVVVIIVVIVVIVVIIVVIVVIVGRHIDLESWL